MRFPPDFVEKVREANNIVDVIAPYTQLRSTGSNFMGRCPFPDHNDKTASFSVSEDKQLYNCFGCKKSGNIFTFLQTFNGQTFPEAIEYLAKRANIALPERDEDPREKGMRELRDGVLAANRLAASYFQDRFSKLPADHPVRTYATQRQLTEELIELFGIGYSPDEWHGLVQLFRARRIPLEVGERGGLLKRSTRAGTPESHFDLFRGRLMFPIVTTAGDTLGFGGRVVGEGEPKYLNTPETPVFHKGKILYGLDVTARYIRSLDEAVIVEGYMDAVSLYGAGITNVAAILGTAFTSDHGRLLRRMTPNVVMLLDGDRAGIQGAERSLAALLMSDLRPRGVILPDNMDPDDFIRERGVGALRELISGAGDLFTILLTRHWMEGYRNTAQDKLRVVEAAAQTLAAAGSALIDKPVLDLFCAEIARFLDVEPAWVKKTLLGALAGRPLRAAGGHPPGPAKSAPKSPQGAANEAASGAVPEGVLVGSEEFYGQQIDLEGLGREELVALALVLQSKHLMQDLSEASRDWLKSGAGKEEHPIAMILEHADARKLLAIALRRYGQQPDAFATLTASLLGLLKDSRTLSAALQVAQGPRATVGGTTGSGDTGVISMSALSVTLGESAESDRRRMGKVMTAIQRRRKQIDLSVISNKLREKSAPEESQALMERFVELQKEIRELQALERE